MDMKNLVISPQNSTIPAAPSRRKLKRNHPLLPSNNRDFFAHRAGYNSCEDEEATNNWVAWIVFRVELFQHQWAVAIADDIWSVD